MSEIFSIVGAVLALAYAICAILVPIAICRTWHWSYECYKELQLMNNRVKAYEKHRMKVPEDSK